MLAATRGQCNSLDSDAIYMVVFIICNITVVIITPSDMEIQVVVNLKDIMLLAHWAVIIIVLC